MIIVQSGAAIVGHIFFDAEEARSKALPVLVHAYAKRSGLDIHPAECSLVECRDGAKVWTEVRCGPTILASWVEHGGTVAMGYETATTKDTI